MQSTGPQTAAATGSNTPGVGSNPPPAPRVMPVYLPQKPSKSHHERHAFSAAHGGQSSSDAERASVKVTRQLYLIPLDLNHPLATHGEKSLGSTSTER
jgi:hypothetical protein